MVGKKAAEKETKIEVVGLKERNRHFGQVGLGWVELPRNSPQSSCTMRYYNCY